MYFQQIRSATIKLKYNDVCFLIDPWLMDACSEEKRKEALEKKKFIPEPIVPLPMTVNDILKDVDYCIVTHDHEDHFSKDYLPLDLPMIFQNQKDAEKGKQLGFTNTDYFKEDQMVFGSVCVKWVDGRHGDTDILAEKAGPVSGFIFSSDKEKKIYLAGDTVYYEGVEDVIKKENPEYIIVNACDARTSSGRLIMNAEDVVKTCTYAKDSMIIVSHMDTVSHAHLTRKELKEYLKNTPYEKQVMIPEDGEIIEIS